MRRRTTLASTVLALGLALAGCGIAGSTATPETTTPVHESPSFITATFPATAGGVTLAKRPTHIVSLSATATEMLFAIGAGDQVVAVDDQSDYPKDAPRTKLSGFKPNAEAIAAKDPDLVVISNDIDHIKDQLTKLKIPVYLAPAAKTLADTYNQFTDLGVLTGNPGPAGAQVTRIKQVVAAIAKSVPTPAKPLTYYYELDSNYYTATSDTFIGSLFQALGLVNIADEDAKGNNYPQLSAEAVIKANPDFIFLADAKCCKQSESTIAKRAGWSDLTAVKKHQVVALDDDVASRWGPRVVDLVTTVASAVRGASTG